MPQKRYSAPMASSDAILPVQRLLEGQRIAFFAPLKSPNHPVPSGDRLMAQQLCSALSAGGAEVVLTSDLRCYLPDPSDRNAAEALSQAAAQAIIRLQALWEQTGPPALWFSYHPYFKSPDLIGPALCRRFAVPYVTAESSWSARRNTGIWQETQSVVLAGLRQAALNICLTRRDRNGIAEAAPEAATALLAPFVDPRSFLAKPPRPESGRLVTVAMMRPGDKAASYAILARALSGLTDLQWRLSIIGDGPARPQVAAEFASISDRIDWHGALPPESVASHLSGAQVYVWPGCGEAYGLAYLEAQAAGLPVVAFSTAGVPEVVAHDISGLLTPDGDIGALSAALRQLLTDSALRNRLAELSRRQVIAHHSIDAASQRLAEMLLPLLDRKNAARI